MDSWLPVFFQDILWNKNQNEAPNKTYDYWLLPPQIIKWSILFPISGNKERLVSLIDTIGFDDPDNDTDTKIIAELVDKLINNCDKIHLFVIAVNGQSPRMDGSLVAMLKIFKVFDRR